MGSRSDRRSLTSLALVVVAALVIAVLSSTGSEASVPSELTVHEAALTGQRSNDRGVNQSAASQRVETQRVTASQSARRLRIIGAAGAGPLPDSSVTFSLAGVTTTLQTDVDGFAYWPSEIVEDVQITVSCRDHVTLRGVLAPPANDEFVTIVLEPAGIVTVTVLDRHGEPSAGIPVALLPPLADGADWAHEWFATRRDGIPAHDDIRVPKLQPDIDGLIHASQVVVNPTPKIAISARLIAALPWDRTTDQNGVVEWRGVAPSVGYRFGILGLNHAQVAPAFERSRLTVTANGVMVGAGAPPNLSGPFDVLAAETSEGRAELEGAGSVFGSIAGAEHDNVLVKLVRIRQAGGDNVERVTLFDAEGAMPTDAGHFRFADVRPGIFVLRACWLRDGRDVYFVSTTFRLEASAELDLGILSPMDGAVATVRVGLQSGEDELATSDVFINAAAAAAVLTISFQPESQNAADAVTEFARVAFGSELVLHGIPSGRLQLQARPALEFLTLPEVQRVDASEVVEKQVFELAGTINVQVPVVRGIRRMLDLRDAHDAPISVMQVQVRNRATGRVDAIEVDSDGKVPLAQSSMIIEPGLYDAWISVECGGGWLANAFELDARDASPSVIFARLEEAASMSGIIVDDRGAPIPNRLVRWSPRPLAEAGIWILSARTAADGSFVVHGVPPGVVVLRDGSSNALGPFSRGQTFSVEPIVAPADPLPK